MSNKKLFLWIFIQCVLFITVILENCYYMKLLEFKVTDTPRYRLEMTMHKNRSMSSITRVFEDIPVPIWHLLLVVHSKNRRVNGMFEAPRPLYNGSYKTCEFWRYAKRIGAFNNVAKLVIGAGNLSLSCPLKVGTYMLPNIQVPSDTAILRLMYRPNSIYTLYGTIYMQLKSKVKEQICAYEINATVFKVC